MTLTSLGNLRTTPDRAKALARYRAMAAEYDRSCRRILALRRAAIDSLMLNAGETVFDVACGTGPTLLALAEKVGARGKVVGIEQSPEMAEIARSRLVDSPLAGAVSVVVSAVEDVRLAERADALLFSYTHDVLQNPAAVRRLMQHAKPGARVAVLATRFLPWWWGAPLNLFTGFRSRNYLTTFHGLSKPWEPLQPYCADIRFVRGFFCGTSCLAVGTVGAGPMPASD
jgi:demethylmenaquinone methyltransferase/2-methoxy-6-polyprenyl-1,4-benzoquinol methylase